MLTVEYGYMCRYVAPANWKENDLTPTESAPDTAEATEREISTKIVDPVDTELAQDPSNTDRCEDKPYTPFIFR